MVLVLIKINQCGPVTHESSLVSLKRENEHGSEGLKIGSGSFSASSSSSGVSLSMIEQKYDTKDLSVSTNVGTVGVDIDHSLDKYKLMGKAQALRSEVSMGPVALNTGLTFDTGYTIGKDGVGIYFGGTGFTLGKKTDISTPIGGFSIDFGKIFG